MKQLLLHIKTQTGVPIDQPDLEQIKVEEKNGKLVLFSCVEFFARA